MKYCSTHGMKGLSFEDVLFSGFLADGGMSLPETIPTIPVDVMKSWVGLSYRDLVLKILPLFVTEDEIPIKKLEELVDTALSTFDTPEIVPIAHLDNGLNVFELFHGRTWAFKDLGLSILGQIFDYFLSRLKRHTTIVIGTSGDTGSAVIEALRPLKWVDVVVVLPRDRCSQIQELQMTTVKADNVSVLRADGTNDDIDVPIKKLFADREFTKKFNLCSVNSLNWSRLMIQIVHFYYAYLKICPSCDKEVEIVIPTGGGGNVTAGLVAQDMGLPVKFVCSVNPNDIVARMIQTGECELKDVSITLAPAMDMQFAYNFERVWYLCSGRDSAMVGQMMKELESSGKTKIPDPVLKNMQSRMQAFTIDNEGIKRTMKRCWEENKYLLCPHTATAAAYQYSAVDKGRDPSFLSICIATASPLKFQEATVAAGLQPMETQRVKELRESPTYHKDMEVDENWEKILRTKIEEMQEAFYARN